MASLSFRVRYQSAEDGISAEDLRGAWTIFRGARGAQPSLCPGVQSGLQQKEYSGGYLFWFGYGVRVCKVKPDAKIQFSNERMKPQPLLLDHYYT